MLNANSRPAPRAAGLALITIATLAALAALAGCSSGASSSAAIPAPASAVRGRRRARRRHARGQRCRQRRWQRGRQRVGRQHVGQQRVLGRERHQLRRRGGRSGQAQAASARYAPAAPAADLHRRAHGPGEERRGRAVDGDVDRDRGRRLRLGREQHRPGGGPARLERDRDRHAQDPGRGLRRDAEPADRRRARLPAFAAAAGAGRDPAGRRREQPGRVRPGGHHPAAGAAQGRRKRRRPAHRAGPDQRRDVQPGVDARAAAGARPPDRLRDGDAHPGRAEGRGQGQGQGSPSRPRRRGSRAG